MKPLTLPDITIVPEVRDCIPARTEKEKKELLLAIREDGKITDPLIAWGPLNVLIDGHGRLESYKTLRAQGIEIPPPAIVKNEKLPDLQAVKRWMKRRALGRRNLSPTAFTIILGELYRDEVARVNNGPGESEEGQNVPERTSQGANHPAATVIANEAGVNERTVRRAAQYVDALDVIGIVNAKAKEDIAAGTFKLSKKDVIDIAKLSPEEIGRALRDARMGDDWRAPKNGTPAREAGDDGDDVDGPALVDAEGHDVPNGPFEAFTNLDKFQALDALTKQLQKGIDELSRLRGGEQLRKHLQATGSDDKQLHKSEHLNALKRDLKFSRPHAVCPWCKGEGKKDCKGCHGTGWVTETTWKSADDQTKKRLQ